MTALTIITPVSIRPMQPEDLEKVHAIEQRSFPTPWSLNSYRNELYGNTAANMWVAELETEAGKKQVIGMIVVWLIVDEAHVGTIAIDTPYRRQGVASKLLNTALLACSRKGALTASLEVRENNLAAQGLYQRFGFELVGRRVRYYRDNHEDALLMTLFELYPALLENINCAGTTQD
ncbi:MAG: ribosomal-protein-alanine N-acetyltransferase [Chloroflexi bacterium]|nr:ribosomal-protein-alanine N-acetyltransferase [Chloroflexota bacterium]